MDEVYVLADGIRRNGRRLLRADLADAMVDQTKLDGDVLMLVRCGGCSWWSADTQYCSLWERPKRKEGYCDQGFPDIIRT